MTMRKPEFITLLGGAAASVALTAVDRREW
jgi:hypothetical protein